MGLIGWIKMFLKTQKNYQLVDVFTPTTYAEKTYVVRPSLEARLSSAINLPGKQIIVFGHSRSGKSTMLNHLLPRESRIISRCVNTTTVNELIIDAFDRLDVFYTSSTQQSVKHSLTGEMKAEYAKISSTIKSSIETSSGATSMRLLPPQLTPQNLARYIGQANLKWVIEDFHKVDDSEKTKLSQIMKLFVDMANEYSQLKIIVVGAAESGAEILAHDSELTNRIVEIEVPLLTPEENRKILSSGEKLLNMKFEPKVFNEIITLSNRLATITHQLAYNACEIAGIKKKQKHFSEITLAQFKQGLQYFADEREATYRLQYKRITDQREGKYENVILILSTMVSLQKDEYLHHEILSVIHDTFPEYPAANLSSYLTKLCSTKGEETLRCSAGRYTFSDPFFKAYLLRNYDSISKSIKTA